MRKLLLIACASLLPLAAFGGELQLKIADAAGRKRDAAALISFLSDKRAVFVGENHDRYDNHLSELEVVRRLHEADPKRWSIGVEFIQRRFQPDLDAYLAGTSDERQFLKKTEYFDRWGFDYRLYRPIFRYAKENRIPVIALNAERELSEKVGKTGLDGLSESERGRLPNDIDKSDLAYRDHLHKIFDQHPAATSGNFEHFYEAQLVWDETMAQTAADYLTADPDKRIIVLVGSEHVQSGFGIPNRVKRRMPGIRTAILLAEDKRPKQSVAADYFLISKELKLSAAGRMGLTMNLSNGVAVKQVTSRGAAAQAGVRPNDRILAVDDQPVQSIGDVRQALQDKEPGDHIKLHLERLLADKVDLTVDLKLQK